MVMPKLIAAAIKFYPKDSEYPQIVCGKRHCDCLEWMSKHQVEYDKTTHRQGFLTEHNQFVDRYEAMYLAPGQLINPENYKPGRPLFSEDLW
jgi:hypothetical protein